jgi:hypothetical protein
LPKDRHIKKSKGRYVLISAGGNIYDKEKFLQILMICSKIKNIHFKVILGSMIPDIEIKKIQNLVKASNIEFLDFSYNIKEYIIDAQLLIGCG